jgi:hypothetical protein
MTRANHRIESKVERLSDLAEEEWACMQVA